MSDALESALIIELAGTLQWSAALPPLDQVTGTLTALDPGLPLDITKYARRDREFQHRDMIAAAAVAKVSIFARTVWNGTVVQPALQGVTEVTDLSGTNIVMPLDPSQVGDSLPNSSTAVQYVLNADVPYAAVQVTDVNLYNRDLMLYETLARTASIFSSKPPIARIDPDGVYIGETSVWATAQGTNQPKLPNAAEPMSQATFKDPDLYLAARDNQIAGYVARVAQALKNPFEFATRIYVQVNSAIGADTQESETYVLTENQFISGNIYQAGEQVFYNGTWYQAIFSTSDVPPSSSWTTLSGPTQLQFLGDPSLDSRNRIVYDKDAKTLQWFRETLDLVHVPQIVGFYIPGILPGQTIQTMAAVPEQKDAQFFRQKSARVEFSAGTYQSQQVLAPTGNRDASSTYVTGGLNTLFQDNKDLTLPIPDSFFVNFQNILCSSGTYALDCLVRPSPNFDVAGGDNDQGSLDTSDGGTTYSAIGDIRNWEIALPAGGWKLFIDFANASATPSTSFGIKATQGAASIFTNTLPLYYTDNNGNALPQDTVISSPGIDIQSSGQVYNFSVQWTSGNGLFHVTRLRFQQVDGPDTSHYIMQASWVNSVSSIAETSTVPGGDAQGVIPTGDGGVDFNGFNVPFNWDIALDAGSWQMVINYSNAISDGAKYFNIEVLQSGISPQGFTLPYTDGTNVGLPMDTIVTSQQIGVVSNGQPLTLGIEWLSASGTDAPGRLHIRDMVFTLLSSQDSVSRLDVFGQANMADVMPFQFYLAGTDSAPQIQITWLPKSASVWQAKSYNPGDQVLYNLVYWQATAITSATDIPGESTNWTQLGIEPQIPLLFEQIQLSKLVETSTTPETTGFQGFRQDMLERALRADQDAYRTALSQVGTNYPEFRETGDSWTLFSTGSWMSFMEVYSPRLRQAGTIASGDIAEGRQYAVITQEGESLTYAGQSYSDGEKFYGLSGTTTFTVSGLPIVNQVGAYRLSHPGDIGKTGLIPAGIEYVRLAGTGTVHGWYPSYASFPTHQAIQPWMIENGFYVADNDLQSPDGNPVPTPSADNAPVSHSTPSAPLSVVFLPEDDTGGIILSVPLGMVTVGSTLYLVDNTYAYSSLDGVTWTLLNNTGGTPFTIAFGVSTFVTAGYGGEVLSSSDAVTWNLETPASSNDMHATIFGGSLFVAVGDFGDTISSSDGHAWTLNNAGTGEIFYGVAFGGGLYVAVGTSGVIYTSSDASTWNAQVSGTVANLRAVTYGNGIFVAVGDGGTILTSSDGSSWNPQSGDPGDLYSVTFGNGLFMSGSAQGDAYKSDNAVTWNFVRNTPSNKLTFAGYFTANKFVILETPTT